MRIKAEWDKLNEVIMHRPGTEITYAMFAPKAFLFERSFNYNKAINEHKNLENILKENGVKTHLLSDLIVKTADNSNDFRRKLEKKVLSLIHFYGTKESMEIANNDLIKNIDYIDSESLFQALILELSIDLKEYVSGIEYPTVYSNIPLANLYFMRDQQAISNGALIGNMRMNQRKKETDITSFVFKEIFNENIQKIEDGYFEGGDFMPAKDFALIGMGNRTNEQGALSAIKSGVINFDEIALVYNPIYNFMKNEDLMVNMHLDTYFNIPADGIAITSIELSKIAKVKVYSKRNDGYDYSNEMTLYDYLKNKDYNIIDLGISEQLSYSSNFLTVSNNKIIAIDSGKVIKKLLKENIFDEETKSRILKDIDIKNNKLFPENKGIKDYGIDFIKIDLSELTGGYGGAHCMTSAINRI